MTVNPLATELAAERRRDLAQRAADRRLASDVRPGPRHARATALTLHVRPLGPGDAPLLADIFARLSPASRLARFLAPKRELSAAELRHLSAVDHHDHEAVIALTRLRGEPVGVARFIRDPDDPTSADVAVEVVDEWQNLGVGTLLARRLATAARRVGVQQLTALMSADNARSRRLLTKMGTVSQVARDGATVTYRVVLPSPVLVPSQRYGAPAVPAGGA